MRSASSGHSRSFGSVESRCRNCSGEENLRPSPSASSNSLSFRPIAARCIDARFDAMLERGLVEELRALRERYALRPGLPSMRCVGYRQVWQFLEGQIDRDELRNRGIFATRRLAKRQLTWLRATPEIRSFDCLDLAVSAKSIAFVRREIKAR